MVLPGSCPAADSSWTAGRSVSGRRRATLIVRSPASTRATSPLSWAASLRDRADVFVDARPRASVDLTGPKAEVTIPGLQEATSVRVEGYLKGELAAVRIATV